MRALVLAAVLVLLPAAAGTVTPGDRMSAPRAAHTATLLASGKVLIAGGCTRSGCGTDSRSARTEIFDPRSGRFSAGPAMSKRRAGHTATLLRDGTVLVVGGYEGEGMPPSASAEIFDVRAAAFSVVGSMTTPRGGATATRLRDGRVLLAGGDDGRRTLASAEIYDPETGTFTPTGSLLMARSAHAATLLPDGRVPVVGGSSRNGPVLGTVETYDPGTGRFTRAGTLRRTRHKLAAVTLRNGTVLVVGGSDEHDFAGRHATAEVFDPRRGRSVRLVRMAEARFKIESAVVRTPSGRVLVAGGGESLEVYDPSTRRFIRSGRIGERLSFSTATLLRSGDVLVAGGYDELIEVTPRTWLHRG